MNAMAEGLIGAGHSVKILAINSYKYSVSPGEIPPEYSAKTQIEMVFIDLKIKPVAAFVNLFTGQSYHVERFIAPAYQQALEHILKTHKFDIIQFETLFTTPYIQVIKKWSDAKLILRAHNIEHLIWQRIANSTKNPLKRFYLNHLYKTLRAYEIETLHKVDGIVAITDKDATWFREQSPGTPVIGIPFGINAGKYVQSQEKNINKQLPTLFHIGSMNWMPNQDGIRWFLNQVWPGLHKQYPKLKFHLAGRAMPDWLLNLKMPGVVIEGEVADAQAFITAHDIMIVPLFSGSGIRIKIIEGMEAGKAIITTAIGAEGIQCRHGEHCMIAGTPQDFVDSVTTLIENPSIVTSMGAQAKKLVLSEHNNQVLMAKLTEFYTTI